MQASVPRWRQQYRRRRPNSSMGKRRSRGISGLESRSIPDRRTGCIGSRQRRKKVGSSKAEKEAQSEVSGYLTSLGRGGDFLDEAPQRNPSHSSVCWRCARPFTVSASSRCGLGNSPGTLKEARSNANTEAGKANFTTEFGNFNRDTKSKAHSGSG